MTDQEFREARDRGKAQRELLIQGVSALLDAFSNREATLTQSAKAAQLKERIESTLATLQAAARRIRPDWLSNGGISALQIFTEHLEELEDGVFWCSVPEEEL